jgi:hypothetical protein
MDPAARLRFRALPNMLSRRFIFVATVDPFAGSFAP